LTPDQQSLRSVLEQLRNAIPTRPDLVYRMAPDFVLRHGAWYSPAPWRREWRQGLPKHCFGNALALAHVHGWRYVEGYALAPKLPLPILHAWNVTPAGEMADVTWRNIGLAYLGVEFSAGRADDATWNGDASVLDDFRRGWPIFRQVWTGEPPGLDWAPSEALRMLTEALGKRPE